jgi:hypothetical protein
VTECSSQVRKTTDDDENGYALAHLELELVVQYNHHHKANQQWHDESFKKNSHAINSKWPE